MFIAQTMNKGSSVIKHWPLNLVSGVGQHDGESQKTGAQTDGKCE